MKWNCPGIKEQIEKIKIFIATSKSLEKDYVAYKALKQLDAVITSELSDKDNDTNSLLTYRRQVRQLLLAYK